MTQRTHSAYRVIVLAHRDVRERDRLYTVLAHHGDVFQVRGSGARRGGAKIAPHVEPLMHSHIMVARHRGRGVMTFALCEESFSALRMVPRAMEAARWLAACTARLARGGTPQPLLYALVLAALRTIDGAAQHTATHAQSRTVALAAFFGVLDLTGWRMNMRQCARCGAATPRKQAMYRYSFSDGGVVCCVRTTQHTVLLSRAAVAFIALATARDLVASHFGRIARVRVSQVVAEELWTVAQRQLRWLEVSALRAQ